MTSHGAGTAAETAIQVVATATVARVAPDAVLTDVARKLLAVEVGALVVSTSAEGVDGIISERDIVRSVAAGADPHTTKASEVAATDLVWCDGNDGVGTVAALMVQHHVRHVLVREHPQLVGIVSARDVLRAYAG